jgi:hypothetical protein
MSDGEHLLTDDEVISFIIRGYHVVTPAFAPGFNEAIYTELEQLTENPGDAILDRVPKLHEVYDHPEVRGALVSLLGEDVRMNGHRHCHVNRPGTPSQSWHQDGTNQRHHHLHTVLAMYYPQEVTPDLGPTVLMPGTHFRNAPTDRMATYANFREQVVLTVPAGTVAITHYDIWHAASANCGDRTRYMLKFLFSRAGESPSPSWRHDPERAAVLLRRFTFEKACQCSQSDHYKERGLRFEMWNHMLGKAGS